MPLALATLPFGQLQREVVVRTRENVRMDLEMLLDENAWWHLGRVREALLPGSDSIRIRRAMVDLKCFQNFMPLVEATLAKHGMRKVSGFEYLDMKAVEYISRFLDAAKDGERAPQDQREVAEICGSFLESRLESIRDTLVWFVQHVGDTPAEPA